MFELCKYGALSVCGESDCLEVDDLAMGSPPEAVMDVKHPGRVGVSVALVVNTDEDRCIRHLEGSREVKSVKDDGIGVEGS